MRTRTLSLALFGTTALAAAVVAACSGSDSVSAPPAPDAGGPPDTGATPPDDGSSAQDAPADTRVGSAVTFSYTPAWKGAKKVEVYGAFGTATDWKQAFVALADSGSGTFTGTAQVPPGQVPYLFKVTGDEAAATGKTDTLARFAVDPGNPAFVPCPPGSPTFDKVAPNPCSQLTAPQAAAAPTYHFRGSVTSGGAPVAGYLVVLERQEPKSHHFFVNRATTGADGAFDVPAATGSYRVQVQHPTYLAQTDAMRTDPAQLAALRRAISSPLLLTQDTTVSAVEVAFAGYAAMQPQSDAGALALPASFVFTRMAGTTAGRLAVYGPGPEIGDPWYAGPLGTATTAEFDGGFNTPQAPDAGLAPDAQYWWGTEQNYPKTDGGVGWTAQTMVLPVRFQ